LLVTKFEEAGYGEQEFKNWGTGINQYNLVWWWGNNRDRPRGVECETGGQEQEQEQEK